MSKQQREAEGAQGGAMPSKTPVPLSGMPGAAPPSRDALGRAPADASAQELRAVLDALPVGVFTLGPDKQVRLLNAEAERLLHVSAADAVGHRCDDAFHCPSCAPGSGCGAEQALTAGQAQHATPLSVVEPDGSTRSLEAQAVPLGTGEVAVTLRERPADPAAAAQEPAAELGPVERIHDALRRSAGSVTLAARLLGVHRTTLWRKMVEAGLDRHAFVPGSGARPPEPPTP